MRKLVVFALLAACGLLAGCVQMHSVTVIEKDGSGTASLEFSMSKSVSDILAELDDLDTGQDMGGSGEIPAFEDLNRDDLEKAAKANDVTITRFEKGMVDGRQRGRERRGQRAGNLDDPAAGGRQLRADLGAGRPAAPVARGRG